MIFRKGPVTDNPWSEEIQMTYQHDGNWNATIGTDQRGSLVQVRPEVEDFKELVFSLKCMDKEAFLAAVRGNLSLDEVVPLVEHWLTGQSREFALRKFAQAIITSGEINDGAQVQLQATAA